MGWVVCIYSVFIEFPEHAWCGWFRGLFIVAARCRWLWDRVGAIVWVRFPPFRRLCSLGGCFGTSVVMHFLRCEGYLFLCIFRREGYSSFAVGLLWPAVGINTGDVAVKDFSYFVPVWPTVHAFIFGVRRDFAFVFP